MIGLEVESDSFDTCSPASADCMTLTFLTLPVIATTAAGVSPAPVTVTPFSTPERITAYIAQHQSHQHVSSSCLLHAPPGSVRLKRMMPDWLLSEEPSPASADM